MRPLVIADQTVRKKPPGRVTRRIVHLFGLITGNFDQELPGSVGGRSSGSSARQVEVLIRPRHNCGTKNAPVSPCTAGRNERGFCQITNGAIENARALCSRVQVNICYTPGWRFETRHANRKNCALLGGQNATDVCCGGTNTDNVQIGRRGGGSGQIKKNAGLDDRARFLNAIFGNRPNTIRDTGRRPGGHRVSRRNHRAAECLCTVDRLRTFGKHE